MKKHVSVIVAAALMAVCLSACGSEGIPEAQEKDTFSIVTTIFPEYDWVMNIIKNSSPNAEVTMLLDNGVDLHSYQPTAEDILKISTSDLFIYVGGESDQWVEGALNEAINKDMVVVNLLDVLGDAVREEEVVEGMQEEEHEHEHEDGEEHEHEHEEEEDEPEYDEHVWLSLRNAGTLVRNISDTLQGIDPANADAYERNTEFYLEKLNDLDKKYKEAVQNASLHTVLFGDRFPFRYLTDDYELDYYAAFAGCSAETEASFETISFLSRKVDELSLPAVLTIEGSDHKIAETIIQNTKTKDQKILTLDSMQSVTAKDVSNGTTYLSVMEDNLPVLKEALGEV